MSIPPISDPLSNSWWPYIIAVIVGIISCIKSYMSGPECPNDDKIQGKRVVITGPTSGIGLETSTELAKRGAELILACRDVEAGEIVKTHIQNKAPNAKLEVKHLDLSSFKSVRAFVKEIESPSIDILINNAGIAFHPLEESEDGFEMHFATNYLGHFLLTHLMLPKLKAAPEARIINVSAQAHYAGSIYLNDLNLKENYIAREAFAQSKLALVLMARYMAKLLKGTKVTINALHPGIVRGTKHMRESPLTASLFLKITMLPVMWLLMKTPVQGAQTSIYASVAPELAQISGKYFGDCDIKEPSEKAKDDKLAEELYRRTCALVNIDEGIEELTTSA